MLKNIEINNAKISYFEESTGKPAILFIHGFNADSSSFNSLKKLQRNYDMITLDLPGNGKSMTNDNLSIEFYNEILEEFIKILGRKNLYLAGHSLGGASVAKLSMMNEVKRGILISPFNPFIHKVLPIEDALKILRPSSLQEALFSVNNLISNPKMKLYFDNVSASAKTFKNFVDNTKDKYKFILEEQILSKEYQENILYEYYNSSKDKLIGVHGKNDKVIPLDSIKEISKSFGIQFEVFDNCGHSPAYEQSELLNHFLNMVTT